MTARHTRRRELPQAPIGGEPNQNTTGERHPQRDYASGQSNLSDVRFNLDQQIADLIEDAQVCALDQIELVRAKLRLADLLLGRVVNERSQR